MARRAKVRYGWMWAGALFFSIGYLVTALGIRSQPFTTSVPSTSPASAPAPVSSAPAPRAAQPLEQIRSPVYATAVLVALTIPFATRARGLLRGALRGLGLGLAGAAGIWAGIGRLARLLPPEIVTASAALAALTTLICCGATGAVFALLAERRRKIYEGAE